MKKAVLITAGTKRIGLALAKHSLINGLAVVAHYRTTAASLKKWITQNPKYKDSIFFIKSDLENIKIDIIEKAQDFPIKLIGLINNASTFTKGDLTDHIDFLNTLNINTQIPLNLSNKFYNSVKTGWIINITDANIKPFNKNFQNYRISKLILTELTQQMAFNYAPKVRVNAIAPGAVLQATNNNSKTFDHIQKNTPLPSKKLLKTILSSYDFLRKNENITGQIIFADSGRHLQ